MLVVSFFCFGIRGRSDSEFLAATVIMYPHPVLAPWGFSCLFPEGAYHPTLRRFRSASPSGRGCLVEVCRSREARALSQASSSTTILARAKGRFLKILQTIRYYKGSSPGAPIVQSRSYLYTLGPKVGIIYILGALGLFWMISKYIPWSRGAGSFGSSDLRWEISQLWSQ